MSTQYMGSSRRLLTNDLSAVDASDMFPPRTTQPSVRRDSRVSMFAAGIVAAVTAAASFVRPAV